MTVGLLESFTSVKAVCRKALVHRIHAACRELACSMTTRPLTCDFDLITMRSAVDDGRGGVDG